MEDFLANIIAALSAGAQAKAGAIGGVAVADAYNGLRALIIHKLGRSGAVQSLEDDPTSSSVQAVLAESLTKGGVHEDAEVVEQAGLLTSIIEKLPGKSGSSINIGAINAQVDVVVSDLKASGAINLQNVRAETGSVYIQDLSAGGTHAKKA